MRRVYHYFGRYGQALEQVLKDNKIKYTVLFAPHDAEPIYDFCIKEESARFDEQLCAVSAYASPLDVRLEYSRQEIENADYYTLMAKSHSVNILNYDEAMLYYCAKPPYSTSNSHVHDQVQIDTFRIARKPKRAKTPFYTYDAGIDVLFCDERVRDLSIQHHLRGLVFMDVKSSKDVVYTDFFQLTGDDVISARHMSFDHVHEWDECPCCGKTRIVLTNESRIYISSDRMDAGKDLYVTARIFGQGIAYPYYIISHRFHTLMKDAGYLANVSCQPVMLAENKNLV